MRLGACFENPRRFVKKNHPLLDHDHHEDDLMAMESSRETRPVSWKTRAVGKYSGVQFRETRTFGTEKTW